MPIGESMSSRPPVGPPRPGAPRGPPFTLNWWNSPNHVGFHEIPPILMEFNENSHNSMKAGGAYYSKLQKLTIVSFWELFWMHPSPRNAWKSQKYAEVHGFYITSRKFMEITEVHHFL